MQRVSDEAKVMQKSLEKIEQLQQQMNAHQIDTYLILTREDSDPVLPLLLPVHVVAHSAFFFQSSGNHIVLTGKTDANMYREFDLFEVVEVEEDFEADFLQIFNKLVPKRLALNISETDYLVDGLTVGQYQLLEDIIGKEKLLEIECSSEKIITHVRSVKTEYEIAQIRKAVEITCDIYDEVAKKIQSGMSETDIGNLFVAGMKKHGVVNAFDEPYSYPLVCINRCGLAHRKPNKDNILQPGDMLICDFSVAYNRYTSDIARTFYVLRAGETEAPDDVQKAFDTTLKAVSAVIDGLYPGMKGFEADMLGRRVVEDAGFPSIRHSAGHQLGMRVHDGGTSLSPKRDDKPSSLGTVQVGEVYAIEPTVIQDNGLPSCIVEEDVVIRAGGAEVLSRRQTELYLIEGA